MNYMSQYLTTYAPKVRVTVKELATGNPKTIGPHEDGNISDDLISLATNKAYGRAAGTFQMMLVYRQMPGAGTYAEAIFPDDLLLIEMDAGAGKGWEVVMLGLVDRTSRTFTSEGGIPQRRVKVSGQDLGKLLQKCDIGWDVSGAQAQQTSQPASNTIKMLENNIPVPDTTLPWMETPYQPQGETGAAKIATSYMRRTILTTGTAESLCRQLFQLFQKTTDGIPSALLTFRSTTTDDWMIWNPATQFIRETNAWDAMKRHDHQPWNMLTTETLDDKTFEVLLEKMPHNQEGKLELADNRMHAISATDIIAEDVGCSDSERINLLCYWPTLYRYSVSDLIDIVLADPDLTKFSQDSIAAHGYCPHTIKDDFVPPSVNVCMEDRYSPQLYPLMGQNAKNRATTYWNWYSNNHNLAGGTVTLHLSPHIKAGHGLLVAQPDGKEQVEYLIEQVAHQCQFHPPLFTTTVHVTRGQIH